MKQYILYILFFFCGMHFLHADVITVDTTQVEVRTFDADKIEKFKKDPRYKYETKEGWLKSAWNRFWNWLLNLLGERAKDQDVARQAGGGNILNALIVFAAVVLLIFGLSRVKFRTWVTGKGAAIEMEYEVEEENIHDINFDKDIRDAESEGDYRRAIRLLFMKVLKNLSDAELIYWDPNKTNHQYLYELKGTSIYQPFVKCVNVFDLVWYGEWEIDQSYYMVNKPLFEELAKGSVKAKTAVYNG
jgi:hypothetical protein